MDFWLDMVGEGATVVAPTAAMAVLVILALSVIGRVLERRRLRLGQVTEMGILATLIQTENRDLTALPNLWIVGRPVTLVQPSGTIVSTIVTLGYDVSRQQATAVMLAAAKHVGLTSPFVRIEELGSFSVSYKVAGLLTDPMRLLETHSQLRGAVLDGLHAAGVEIVSPKLISSRGFPTTKRFVPEPSSTTEAHEHMRGDEVVFDEASAAAERESQREVIRVALNDARARRDAVWDPAKRKPLTAEVERLEKALAALDA